MTPGLRLAHSLPRRHQVSSRASQRHSDRGDLPRSGGPGPRCRVARAAKRCASRRRTTRVLRALRARVAPYRIRPLAGRRDGEARDLYHDRRSAKLADGTGRRRRADPRFGRRRRARGNTARPSTADRLRIARLRTSRQCRIAGAAFRRALAQRGQARTTRTARAQSLALRRRIRHDHANTGP